jgi:CubicO group peptidase (beta-lactamase class C family)
MKIRNKLFVYCLLICLNLSFAAGQNAGDFKVEMTSMPAATEVAVLTNLSNELLDLFKSNSREETSRFVKERIDPAMFDLSSEESVVSYILKIAEQSGGLEVLETNRSKPNEKEFLVRARRGGQKARLKIFVSKKNENRLKDFSFELLPSEVEMRVRQWSNQKMSGRDALAEIGKRAEELAKLDKLSGVLLISKEDKILFHRSYGNRSQSLKKPNRTDTLFSTASMGKMFTAIAVAQLLETGRLSLEDTLDKVLPSYPDKDAARRIKIRHLLSHQSGLGNFFNQEFRRNPDRYVRPAEYYPLFAEKPLFFEPGTGWVYSNAGMVVLGAVVEQISGGRFEDYLRKNVFKPAGMKDTFYDSSKANQERLANSHLRSEISDPLHLELRAERHEKDATRRLASPAGGSFTNARDMFRFVRALQKGRLVKPEILTLFTTPQTETAASESYAYGFESFVFNGKKVYGHSGGAPGINSNTLTFADGSYTVVIMSNYDPGFAQKFARDIARLLAGITNSPARQ